MHPERLSTRGTEGAPGCCLFTPLLVCNRNTASTGHTATTGQRKIPFPERFGLLTLAVDSFNQPMIRTQPPPLPHVKGRKRAVMCRRCHRLSSRMCECSVRKSKICIKYRTRLWGRLNRFFTTDQCYSPQDWIDCLWVNTFQILVQPIKKPGKY